MSITYLDRTVRLIKRLLVNRWIRYKYLAILYNVKSFLSTTRVGIATCCRVIASVGVRRRVTKAVSYE